MKQADGSSDVERLPNVKVNLLVFLKYLLSNDTSNDGLINICTPCFFFIKKNIGRMAYSKIEQPALT